MIIYWATLCFTVLFEWLSMRAKPRSGASARLLAGLAMLAPTLTLGLRVGIGTDYYTYQDIFYWNAAGVQGSIEYGWYLYSKLCYFIVPDYRFQLLFTAALFIGLSRRAIEKLSPNPAMSVFLLIAAGFFFASMNLMKQMLAASILLNALVYARESKPVPFFVSIAVATMIHTSAIVFALVYFVRYLSNKGLIAVGAAFMVLVISGLYGNLVESIAGSFEKYANYYGSAYDKGGVAYVAILVDASVLAMVFILRRKMPFAFTKGGDLLPRVLLAMQVLSFFLALTVSIVPLGDRLRRYFSYGMVIFVPYLLGLIEDKKMRFFVTLVIVAAFCAYMQITIAVMGHYGVFPYVGLIG